MSVILGVLSLVSFQCENHLNEWSNETCFKSFLWGTITAEPYHTCKPSAWTTCQWPGDQWGTRRFQTHANYVHLCWKATALARRPSHSIRIFTWIHNSHCIPSLVLQGLPLQIPLCVYTAAVLYGLFLICSIKHIVYKRVCLLGFFQGSNYQVKYRRKITLSTVVSWCMNGTTQKNKWTQLPAGQESK